MSVNYLIEINSLDDWELTHNLSATAYKLMRKLQYLANKERFPRTLSVSNSVLIGMVGCSKDGLIRAREQLIDAGLIRYRGHKRCCPQYELQYFSGRRDGAKSAAATYPAPNPATETAPYAANTIINKTGQNAEEDIANDTRGRAPAIVSQVRSSRDDRMRKAIDAFLRHLATTQYAHLFDNAAAMRQLLDSGRFPMDLVGEALEMALERHRRYPLHDGAGYALQLLVDWTDRGIETPEQLHASRDDYSDAM